MAKQAGAVYPPPTPTVEISREPTPSASMGSPPHEPQSDEVAETIHTFTIVVSGTHAQMVALRRFIDANGITYRKLDYRDLSAR